MFPVLLGRLSPLNEIIIGRNIFPRMYEVEMGCLIIYSTFPLQRHLHLYTTITLYPHLPYSRLFVLVHLVSICPQPDRRQPSYLFGLPRMRNIKSNSDPRLATPTCCSPVSRRAKADPQHLTCTSCLPSSTVACQRSTLAGVDVFVRSALPRDAVRRLCKADDRLRSGLKPSRRRAPNR